MPIDLQELINSRCGAAVEALLHNLWADVVSYRMRAMQQQGFFQVVIFSAILFLRITDCSFGPRPGNTTAFMEKKAQEIMPCA